MKITDVKFRKIDKGGLKAVASVTFDDAFVVHDFKVMESKNGLFVSMPSKKVGDKYFDVSHPTNSEYRNHINSTLLDYYQRIS